jgi:hypothetical protein
MILKFQPPLLKTDADLWKKAKEQKAKKKKKS